jgi:hypothetical protein
VLSPLRGKYREALPHEGAAACALARGAEELPYKFDVRTVRGGMNFKLATDLGDIDLFGEVAGLGFYDGVLEVSETKQVGPIQCHVLSIDGLIRTKIAAGRKKDVEVLEELNGLQDLKERLGES